MAESSDVELAFCWAHVRRRFYELAAPGAAPIASEELQSGTGAAMQHRQNGDPLGMPAVASCRSQRRVLIQCDQATTDRRIF
jgi:transposase